MTRGSELLESRRMTGSLLFGLRKSCTGPGKGNEGCTLHGKTLRTGEPSEDE